LKFLLLDIQQEENKHFWGA